MSPIFGWDASHYDRPPTARDGIDFYTHKIAEGRRGFYADDEYGASLNAARALGIPILGAYYVNHPGDQAGQVAWAIELADRLTPWWREHPAFIWQIDAEKFEHMDREPNLGEINAFGDGLVRAGVPAARVLVYAPRWLYGDKLRGLRYRLWASDYGSNPAVPYRQAYPGDTSSRWAPYSGQAPLILQYGSKTTIAGQTTCDANAYRGTLDELLAEIGADMFAADPKTDPHATALIHRVYGLQSLATTINNHVNNTTEPNPFAVAIRRIDTNTGRIEGLVKTVQALADAINAGGGSIETTAILARIDERAAEDVERDAEQARRIAELETKLAAAEQREADAARAAADAYGDGGAIR